MKSVPLEVLENRIIRPGIEEHLKPLLRYKGAQRIGRIHRLWNLVISAKEHEATASDVTQRLLLNPAYSQLCVPDKQVTLQGLSSFVGRLLNDPQVMGEEPHLEEYIRDLIPPYKLFRLVPLASPPDDFAQKAKGKSISWAMDEYGHDYRIIRRWFEQVGIAPTHANLIPIPRQFRSFAEKEHNYELARRFEVGPATVARWRSETGLVCLAPRRTSSVPQGAIIYPFVIHDGGKPEHALLRKVNAAVPKHFDPETRADICQDLVVGILCGDFNEDDLLLPAKEMTRRVQKMFPTKYGPLSLDAALPGTDDFRLIDTLSEEDGLWAA